MKKVLSLVLIVVMCLFALTSCGLIDKITGWFNPTTTTTTTPPTPATTAENARDYLSTLYNGYLDNNKTAANFELLSSFNFGGGAVTVAWTSTNDQITFVPKEGDEDTVLVVTLPERGENDIEYTITGVLTAADGTTAQLSYDLVVPKMALTTYDEYAAAADAVLITAEGVVTGISSKSTGSTSNSIYFQNADGGFYAYALDDEQMTGVEVGMTVRVSGTKKNWNGTYEIENGKVTIVSTEKTPVTPVDYTDIIKSAADLGDANLVGKQAFLVTIKGVTVQEVAETNGYYYFQIGEHKVYLRISSSNNPCTKEDLEAIKAAHAANFGNTCDVTGLVSIYNKQFYLSPVSADAFNNFTVVEKTEAEKVAIEKENFSITNSYNASGSYTLPVCGKNYSDVAVSWVSGSELIVIGENGAITVTVPDTKTTVTLTATFTCGESTETKEFEVTLNKTVISVSDALEIANAQDSNGYTADKYLVGGIITSIKSDVYGNMTISDGVNELYVYGVYSTDGANKFETLDPKPAVGDYIVLLGVLGQYNGSSQLKSGWLVSFASPTSIPDANTAAETAGSSYSENKYLVSGTVSSVVSETYGNMYIKDADGNEFYVYGLYDLAGTRYDALTTKPAVGDVVVLYGVVGQYTNKSGVTTNQMKSATLVSLVQGEKEPEIPTEDGKVTVYFTVKDSVELNSFNRYYFTGTLTGWKSGKEAPVFTNLEGTDIWYMIVDVTIDKTVNEWNNYKLIIGTENDGLKWQRSWTTTSAPNYGEKNCEFEYNEGDQLVNLGEHTFVGQPAAETFTGWSVIGHFENLADVYHEWRGDFDLAPTDEANILESGWITINATKDNFKVRKDFGWGESYGNSEGKDFKVDKDGTYKIRFNTETHEVSVVEKVETPVVSTTYDLKTIFTTTNTTTADIESSDGLVTFKLVKDSAAGNKAGQLRVYQDKEGVIEFSKAITSLTINAQGKEGTATSNATVYVSNDGVNYTKVSTVSFTAASDANFTLDGSYKYVKIAAADKQLQILSITVVYE